MSTQRPTFNAGELNVYPNPKDVREVSRALRHTGRRVMLVPTMGALHDGHLALVRAAKRVPGSVVVVSIFVNPLQFGAEEDLDAYPRILDDDLALLRGEGVEIAFTPSAVAMYPEGPRTTVYPGPLGSELEGAARPTHFAGMHQAVQADSRGLFVDGTKFFRLDREFVAADSERHDRSRFVARAVRGIHDFHRGGGSELPHGVENKFQL